MTDIPALVGMLVVFDWPVGELKLRVVKIVVRVVRSSSQGSDVECEILRKYP